MKKWSGKLIVILAFLLGIDSIVAGAMTDQDVNRAANIAQMESRKYAVFLDCHLDSMVSSKKKDWTTDYGSYSADTVSFKRYIVKIMNHEPTTKEYVLNWTFIGRVDDAKIDTVVERGEKKIYIRPKESVEIVVQSDTYSGRKSVYAMLGEKMTDGVKIKGLVLQLIQDGKVARTWYSSQQWKARLWLVPFELQ